MVRELFDEEMFAGRAAARAAGAPAATEAPPAAARRDRAADPRRDPLDRLRDRDHRRRWHRLRGRDDRDRPALPARVLPDDRAAAADPAGRLRRRSPALVLAAHFGTAFNVLLVGAASFPLLFAFGAEPQASRGDRRLDGRDRARRRSGSASRWSTPCCCATCPNHGAALLIDVLVGTFATDTGAYATGRMFGSHRIAPEPLAQQDPGGAGRRLPDRHHGLLVRGPLPGLALRRRRAGDRRRGRRGRAARRPLRVDAQARPGQRRTRAGCSAPTAASSTASTRSSSRSSSATTSRPAGLLSLLDFSR